MEHWDGQMDLFDANPQREVSRDQSVVVFDLETQRSFAEVGGRSQMDKLGVSVGVAYRYDQSTTFSHLPFVLLAVSHRATEPPFSFEANRPPCCTVDGPAIVALPF